MSHAPSATAPESRPAPLPNPAPGWTPDRIRFFLEQLARSGNVVAAGGKLGISRQAAYQLKRRMPAFALAWDGAILRAAPALRLAPARRRHLLLRFGLSASGRLHRLLDPEG